MLCGILSDQFFALSLTSAAELRLHEAQLHLPSSLFSQCGSKLEFIQQSLTVHALPSVATLVDSVAWGHFIFNFSCSLWDLDLQPFGHDALLFRLWLLSQIWKPILHTGFGGQIPPYSGISFFFFLTIPVKCVPLTKATACLVYISIFQTVTKWWVARRCRGG